MAGASSDDKVIRRETILAQVGVAIKPFTLELDAQHTPIRGVIVDNGSGPSVVYVYGGRSPTGPPAYIVKSGQARSFAIAGTSAVTFVFPDVPLKTGATFITAQSKAESAFAEGGSGDLTPTSLPLTNPASTLDVYVTLARMLDLLEQIAAKFEAPS